MTEKEKTSPGGAGEEILNRMTSIWIDPKKLASTISQGGSLQKAIHDTPQES